MIDVSHEGHASGPRAAEFGSAVQELVRYLEDERNLARLYNALIQRKQANTFNARSLNVSSLTSPIMKRIQGASTQVTLQLLREMLSEEGSVAIPQTELVRDLVDKLDVRANQVRHLMTELGWSLENVKWGGKDYTRAIWVREGYQVTGGRALGPNGYKGDIGSKLPEVELFDVVERASEATVCDPNATAEEAY